MIDLDELVSALRSAPEPKPNEVPAEVEELTLAAVEDHVAVLGVLSRTDLPESARRLVLDAVIPLLDGPEFITLGRVVGGQRAVVLKHVVDTLKEVTVAEAAMVLRVVIAAKIGEEAATATAAVASKVLARSPVRGLVEGDLASVYELPAGTLGAALLCLDLATLADLRERERLHDGDMTAVVVEEELSHLDEALRGSDRSSESEGERLMRLALYRATLVLNVPREGALAERARDWLFAVRPDDLDGARDVAERLPDDALEVFLARCLGREQRRGSKIERTVLALQLVPRLPEPGRRSLRTSIVACLDDDRADVRLAALLALAGDGTALKPDARDRMAQVFGDLPASDQEIAAPALAVLGSTAELDSEAFLRWAASAPEAEVQERLDTLLARWRSSDLAPAAVAAFVTVAGTLCDRLDDDTRPRAVDSLIATIAGWLRTQGARIVEPLKSLREWPGLADAFVDRVDVVGSTLNADQARKATCDVVRTAPDVAGAVARLARASSDDDQVSRVVIPALVMVGEADGGTSLLAAFDRVDDIRAQSILLTAALLTLRSFKVQIAEQDAGDDEREAAVLGRRLSAIGEALTDAEREAQGNDALLEHFGALRHAIAGLGAELEERAVPAGAAAWRSEALDRYAPFLGQSDDERQMLIVVGDPLEHVPQVAELLQELEQRAHNQRVVAEDERGIALIDLKSVARGVAQVGCVDPGGPLDALMTRPALGQQLAAAWAEHNREHASALIEQALEALAGPSTDRALVIRVDALASQAFDPESLRVCLGRLTPDGRAALERALGPVVAARGRDQAERVRRSKGRDADVMTRVAGRIDVPLQAIESLLFSYFRFRQSLHDAGWKTVEDRLGAELKRSQVNPERHEEQGNLDAPTVHVRSTGLQVKGRVVRRAVVDGGQPEKEAGT